MGANPASQSKHGPEMLQYYAFQILKFLVQVDIGKGEDGKEGQWNRPISHHVGGGGAGGG